MYYDNNDNSVSGKEGCDDAAEEEMIIPTGTTDG